MLLNENQRIVAGLMAAHPAVVAGPPVPTVAGVVRKAVRRAVVSTVTFTAALTIALHHAPTAMHFGG